MLKFFFGGERTFFDLYNFETVTVWHAGCVPFWICSILDMIHFGYDPFWISSILDMFHFGYVPFWICSILNVFRIGFLFHLDQWCMCTILHVITSFFRVKLLPFCNLEIVTINVLVWNHCINFLKGNIDVVSSDL